MTCRICYEPENLESVCKCDGSVKWVHVQCVQKWIDVSQRRNCELCHEPFEHRLLMAPPAFKVAYVETLAIGFTLGCVYTMFAWLIGIFSIQWVSIINFVLLNVVFVFISLVFARARKRLCPMIIAYFSSYTMLNIIINIIHYSPISLPFYIGDISVILVLLTADIFGAHFRNNRV
jgi:hypothetical protein